MILDNILIDGNKEAKKLLILAHGAGSPMDSVFMNTIVKGIIERDILVIRFEFPYMSKRRLGKTSFPDKVPFLCAFYKDIYHKIKKVFPKKDIWIGGKSMGGRVSAIISKEINVSGVIVLGYPFHPINNKDKLRLDCLQSDGPSILIIQGTRDKFGSINEVKKYNLNKKNSIFWLEDGDHSFKTLKKSKNNSDDSIKEAYFKVSSFILESKVN
ncbi:alpha/beta hydrolase [Alphaproteobacteria bacterium]|nr:alpha/beta hydrolase [Alphaproteobacteria bacterium]